MDTNVKKNVEQPYHIWPDFFFVDMMISWDLGILSLEIVYFLLFFIFIFFIFFHIFSFHILLYIFI
jgi:hypothetical protein